MMKNVCVIGYGAIGPVHTDAIVKTESAKLYAVCDINPQKIELCKEKCDVVGYTDIDEMLCDENIHSVHICTPHYLHFEMIKKSLAAGKDVVVEKPVTMTKAEFDELLTLENADKVCVVLQNRLNPAVAKLKDIAEKGELGKIKGAKGILTWSRYAEYYAQDEWRGKYKTEGGGVLINQAVHTLDYFSYIAGGVDSVKAQMTNFSIDEIEVEDTVSASLKLKNGTKGVFFATNAYVVDSAPVFEVLFENGVAKYTEGKLLIDGNAVAEDSKPEIGKAYWGTGHIALIKRYYDSGEYFSLDDVKNTMYTMFAMYESANCNAKNTEIQK